MKRCRSQENSHRGDKRKKKKKGLLTHSQYLKKVQQSFIMNEQTKPVSTLLVPHYKLSAQLCHKNDEDDNTWQMFCC